MKHNQSGTQYRDERRQPLSTDQILGLITTREQLVQLLTAQPQNAAQLICNSQVLGILTAEERQELVQVRPVMGASQPQGIPQVPCSDTPSSSAGPSV